VKIATKDFSFTYDGQREEAVANQTRVYDDSHPVVLAHPDCWRDGTAQDEARLEEQDRREELQIRKERVEQLKRDAARPKDSRPRSAAGRRQADEDQFWAMVDRQLHPSEPVDPVQSVFDEGQRTLERFDEARFAELRHDLTEAWQGRIEG
jgi:hypothetical protein